MKRQPEWKKTLTNYAVQKLRIPRNYKELKKLTISKNYLAQKSAKEMSRQHLKDEIQIANRHMKTCSALLTIREIQIKTTTRFSLTQLEWLLSENQKSISACTDVWEKISYTIIGGNIKWYNRKGRQLGGSSEMLK